jgi:hypothetical protein
MVNTRQTAPAVPPAIAAVRVDDDDNEDRLLAAPLGETVLNIVCVGPCGAGKVVTESLAFDKSAPVPTIA